MPTRTVSPRHIQNYSILKQQTGPHSSTMARRFTDYGEAEKLLHILEQPAKDVQELVAFMNDILHRVDMAKGCNASADADNIDQIKANFEKLIHHHRDLARRMGATESRTFPGDFVLANNESFKYRACGDFLAYMEGARIGLMFGLIFWILTELSHYNAEHASILNIWMLGYYLDLLYNVWTKA